MRIKMTRPQSGIFAEQSTAFEVIEYRAKTCATLQQIRMALAELKQQLDTIELVIGFGPKLLQTLTGSNETIFDEYTPRQSSHGHQAPATQTDLFLWFHSNDQNNLAEALIALQPIMEKVMTMTQQCSGFKYRDNRDLTGFVDGSANPKDLAAKQQAALVAAEHPLSGGSFILGQIWQHQLSKFHHQSISEQEQIIGRTKADSIELSGKAMPNNSHVNRTDLTIDEVAQKMYRRSMPFANASQQGLYFLGFSCQLSRFDALLDSMYGLTDDGITDRLLDFSQPVSGSYWFAPSEDMLATLLQS
ncbi:hypothetical protein B1199_04065 [Pseudoalteromonas ulvae]|uniref:Peroxidase n=2 Tax=Pseudoalteromonas ulvae TaxID=107327 RepID=A0A244CUZ9_PSEDV|nr:hypothetical protein B1199_04065 [Pseudoalteromonas ulvae]